MRTVRKFNSDKRWFEERLMTNYGLKYGFMDLGEPYFFGGYARHLAPPIHPSDIQRQQKNLDEANIALNKLRTLYQNNAFDDLIACFKKDK